MGVVLHKLRDFASAEEASISVDWLVLTAVLIGTGFAVVGTMASGLGAVSSATTEQLRGQVIRQSFGPPNLCAQGVDGLRLREEARIAAGGADAVNVDSWLPIYADGLSDAGLRAERDRMEHLANRVTPAGDWSRARTLQGLLECRIAQRGL